MYNPDKWLIVQYQDYYKIFATWYGGYLDGDSWRISSVIVSVEEDGNFLIFTTHSGSLYKCHKKMYGCTAYGSSVLDNAPEGMDILEHYNQHPLFQ